MTKFDKTWRQLNKTILATHTGLDNVQAGSRPQATRRLAAGKAKPLTPQPIGYIGAPKLVWHTLKAAHLWVTSSYSWHLCWHTTAR